MYEGGHGRQDAYGGRMAGVFKIYVCDCDDCANYPHQALKGGYFVFVRRVGT